MLIATPASITRIAGSNEASLNCRVNGIPVPTITWLKNGVSVSPDGRVIISSSAIQFPQNEPIFGFRISSILFFNLQLTDDADYTCKAENDGAPGTVFQVQSQTAHVTVLCELNYTENDQL